jgi:class 3 adenylate cyclase
MRCPTCGEDNPDRAKFCLDCAAPLTVAASPREVRKSVTIIFSDVAGSTAMGEGLDPETLRKVMGRYFDAMKAEIERHGGTVEKFIGDAVMAVFGIPRTHEDDALRAVRAALDMRRVLDELNEGFRREQGVEIAVRTGINTGEVVAGEASEHQRLVTGDAVNVAARFEQAAGSGEVLLGRETYHLVRDAVEVEDVEPLVLKGKSEPVSAYRLLSLKDDRARRTDAVFVGRTRERGRLEDAYARSVEEHSAALFTAFGIAGKGQPDMTCPDCGVEPSPMATSKRV